MLTEGFFKLHFEDQDVKQNGFVIDLKVMLDADMFDGAAFAGKPSAVLDIIMQAQLFEAALRTADEQGVMEDLFRWEWQRGRLTL